jgi:hypothetical protein
MVLRTIETGIFGLISEGQLKVRIRQIKSKTAASVRMEEIEEAPPPLEEDRGDLGQICLL